MSNPCRSDRLCYLGKSWWRHEMETFSALLALCAGNSSVTGEFPAQRPVTRNFGVLFDLRLDKRLSKESWVWCLGRPSRLSWRHCNVLTCDDDTHREPFLGHRRGGVVVIGRHMVANWKKKIIDKFIHHNWELWCLKLPTTALFIQQLILESIKTEKTNIAPCYSVRGTLVSDGFPS